MVVKEQCEKFLIVPQVRIICRPMGIEELQNQECAEINNNYLREGGHAVLISSQCSNNIVHLSCVLSFFPCLPSTFRILGTLCWSRQSNIIPVWSFHRTCTESISEQNTHEDARKASTNHTTGSRKRSCAVDGLCSHRPCLKAIRQTQPR